MPVEQASTGDDEEEQARNSSQTTEVQLVKTLDNDVRVEIGEPVDWSVSAEKMLNILDDGTPYPIEGLVHGTSDLSPVGSIFVDGEGTVVQVSYNSNSVESWERYDSMGGSVEETRFQRSRGTRDKSESVEYPEDTEDDETAEEESDEDDTPEEFDLEIRTDGEGGLRIPGFAYSPVYERMTHDGLIEQLEAGGAFDHLDDLAAYEEDSLVVRGSYDFDSDSFRVTSTRTPSSSSSSSSSGSFFGLGSASTSGRSTASSDDDSKDGEEDAESDDEPTMHRHDVTVAEKRTTPSGGVDATLSMGQDDRGYDADLTCPRLSHMSDTELVRHACDQTGVEFRGLLTHGRVGDRVATVVLSEDGVEDVVRRV